MTVRLVPHSLLPCLRDHVAGAALLLGLCFAALTVPVAAHAAQSGQAISPQFVTVEGGQSQVFSARFTDAQGMPAAGATVHFSNDACGYFSNGGFTIAMVTDANGVASATFTAMLPAGITCWLVAQSAPAVVQFNVVTWSARQVSLSASMWPTEVHPGQPFTLEVSPWIWGYRLQNVEIGARIVPGSGAAALSTALMNTASDGRVIFTITPDASMGDYTIELTFRGLVTRVPVAAGYTGVWWGGAQENGWGVAVTQHTTSLVAGWYFYDSSGRATWSIMPACTWNAALNQCSGPVFESSGAWFGHYDAARFAQTATGNATFSFADRSNATLTYSAHGATIVKPVTRLELHTGADGAVNYSDIWWAGAAENGWGLALSHQGAALVGSWYTYDSQGRATWLLMNAGTWTTPTTFQGTLVRASGAPLLAAGYDASAFAPQAAGTITLQFTDANHATMSYSVDGVTQSKAIARFAFGN